MPRGLLAPLSPNEEITLRRVALGIVLTKDLSPGDVVRLRNLALVQDRGEHLELTPLGKQRYDGLLAAVPPASKPLNERIAAFGRSLQAFANNKPKWRRPALAQARTVMPPSTTSRWPLT